jgi:hypothetical protein
MVSVVATPAQQSSFAGYPPGETKCNCVTSQGIQNRLVAQDCEDHGGTWYTMALKVDHSIFLFLISFCFLP